MKFLNVILLSLLSFSANAQQWVLDEIADDQKSSESLPVWFIVSAIIIGYFVYKYIQKKDDEEATKRAKEYRERERQRVNEELEEYREEKELEELDRDVDFSFFEDDLVNEESDLEQNQNMLGEDFDDDSEAFGNFFEEPDDIGPIDFRSAREAALRTSASRDDTCENTTVKNQESITFGCDDIEPIDLGLSIKWANYNLKASSADLIGKFFIWGEVIEHDKLESSIRLEKVGKCAWKEKDNYAYTLDGKEVSELKELLNGKTSICGIPNYDVASKLLGHGWRLPSKKEAEELQHRCKWTLTTINGIRGTKVTGPNGNSIFIPFAGYIAIDPKNPVGIGSCGFYWLGDPSIDNKGYAAAFALQEDASPYFPVSNAIVNLRRCNAYSIRPVFDDNK